MNSLWLFQISEVTLPFGIDLMIQGRPQVVAIRKSSPSPSIEPKGKWASSPSMVRKVKKSKGSAHPLNFTLGLGKVSTMGEEVEGRAPQDLARIAPLGVGKAFKMEERGSTGIAKAWLRLVGPKC